MSAINEVLHRRSDLATFVVHFTRRTPTSSAEENLVQMLVNGCIEARTPMGWARGIAERAGPAAVDSQKVVCFSEAPLEHLYSLTADINGRRIALEPYGIAFTKMVVRRRGANPVWYVDMSYGHDWKLARALDRLRDDLASHAKPEDSRSFGEHPAAALLPFYEGMGTWASRQKEFWWEREWRKAGNFAFAPSDVALIVAPQDTHVTLRRHFARPVIDASWGLERMIASLANVPMTDVTPFS